MTGNRRSEDYFPIVNFNIIQTPEEEKRLSSLGFWRGNILRGSDLAEFFLDPKDERYRQVSESSVYFDNILSPLREEFNSRKLKWTKAISKKFLEFLKGKVSERIENATVITRMSDRTTLAINQDRDLLKKQSDLFDSKPGLDDIEIRIGEDFYTLERVQKSKKFKTLYTSARNKLMDRYKLQVESLKSSLRGFQTQLQDKIDELERQKRDIIEMPKFYSDDVNREDIRISISGEHMEISLPIEFETTKVSFDNKVMKLKQSFRSTGRVHFLLTQTGNVDRVLLLKKDGSELPTFHSYGSGRLCLGSLHLEPVKDIESLLKARSEIVRLMEVINQKSWLNSTLGNTPLWSLYVSLREKQDHSAYLVKEEIKEDSQSVWSTDEV